MIKSKYFNDFHFNLLHKLYLLENKKEKYEHECTLSKSRM